MPDFDTMFGFGDDEDEDQAEPVADDNSTDWMTQYDDDDAFPVSEPEAVTDQEDEEEPADNDTGWLAYDEADVVEDYDPYAQYDDDEEDYEDIFTTESDVDVETLADQSNLFDVNQPVAEPVDTDETPDWLTGYDHEDFASTNEPAQPKALSEDDTGWLEQYDDEAFDEAVFDGFPPDPLRDIPDWLKEDDSSDAYATSPDLDADQFADESEMAADDLLADLEGDETISRVPTGFTDELEDFDDNFEDEFDLDSLSEADELGDFEDEFDLDSLSEADETISRVPAGLDDADFDLLDDLDLDDLDLEGLDLEGLDDLDLEGMASSDLLAELDDLGDDEIADLENIGEDLDLSFLDEVEEGESTDWFGEDSEEAEESEPEWMRTLNEANVDDLMADVGDGDLDDIFSDSEIDSLVYENAELGAPAADLDSLLASFDDVEDADFAEDDNLSQIEDLDAIFDAALSHDEDVQDDLPENIPDWLRDIDVSSDESSAAAIIRQQSDKPLEELDDRLQALRERGLSVSSEAEGGAADSTPEILSDVPEKLATPHIAHQVAELISDVNLTSVQQKQAKLLQDIVGVTITPTVETDAEGVPIVESSRRDRRLLPNIGLGRLLVASILVLVMILPFVSGIGIGALPPRSFGADNSSANAVFNQIEALNEGDWVLVGFEYGPTSAGELDSVADILLRHIFSQGARPIIVSSNPIAIVHAQNILNNINDSLRPTGLSIEANRDFYIARYLAGGTLGLRDLSQNLDSIIRVDVKGNLTNLKLASLDDVALMLLIAERSEDIRNWAEQIVPVTHTRLIAATGYAAQPLAEPYVNHSDGITGLIVGYRDAYTYGEMLQGIFATATPLPTATFTETATPTMLPTMTDTPVPTETPVSIVETEGSSTDSTGASGTTPLPSDTPTDTPVPSNTPVPTATASDTPVPTATATDTPSPSPTPKLITVIVVTSPDPSVNIRSGPGTSFDIVTTASPGDVFQVIDENDDGSWIHFMLPDGREGWIAAFLVEKTELPEAELQSDDSASAGRDVTIMRVDYTRRMGKNGVRYYQQAPTETATVTGTPPTATPTFTPSLTFTPSVTPTATQTATATPDPLASYVFSRDRSQENSRLNAMTLGTIAAIVIILLGNIFYGLRAVSRRRQESKR
jgi:hypothetical protein